MFNVPRPRIARTKVLYTKARYYEDAIVQVLIRREYCIRRRDTMEEIETCREVAQKEACRVVPAINTQQEAFHPAFRGLATPTKRSGVDFEIWN